METESQFGQASDSVATVSGSTAAIDTATRSNVTGSIGDSSLKRPKQHRPMVTGRLEQVSSFLMALILMIGSVVALMFVAWMMTPPHTITPAPITNLAKVTFHSDLGEEREFEEPSQSEIEALKDPSLKELVQQVTDLPQVTELPSNTQASSNPVAGIGYSRVRPANPGERDGTVAMDFIPRYERWVLKFAAGSEREFASQLSALNIELAAFGGGRKGIDYAATPFNKSVSRLGADPTTEKRLYFSWNQATPLQGYERSLIQQAGIATAGRNLVKFIAPELENSLAIKELEYAQKHGFEKVTEIAKTVFECQAANGGYDFVVIDQRYLK